MKPLDNFPLIRSRNVEEVRGALARVYAKPTLVPANADRPLQAIFNNCRLEQVELAYGTYGAAVEFEFPDTRFFSQLLPLRGNGEIICGPRSVTVTAGAGAVISSGTGHKARYSEDYEHLVLRIDARLLTDKLAAMAGATINAPLRIDHPQNLSHPAARMLQQYLPLLAATLSEATSPFPNWWVAQTEQFLMALFLFSHRHNYSHLLEKEAPDAALRQVRQAEEYIEANAQRAISLEELADVAGVSAFSLFSAFKKRRGYSPSEFLAQVRSKRGARLR